MVEQKITKQYFDRRFSIGASEMFTLLSPNTKKHFTWLYNKLYEIQQEHGEFVQRMLDHGNIYEQILFDRIDKNKYNCKWQERFTDEKLQTHATTDIIISDLNNVFCIEVKFPYIRYVEFGQELQKHYLIQVLQQCILTKMDVVYLEIKMKGEFIIAYNYKLMKYSNELKDFHCKLFNTRVQKHIDFLKYVHNTKNDFDSIYNKAFRNEQFNR